MNLLVFSGALSELKDEIFSHKNFRKNEKLVTRKSQILYQSTISGYVTYDEAKKAGKYLTLELISDIN